MTEAIERCDKCGVNIALTGRIHLCRPANKAVILAGGLQPKAVPAVPVKAKTVPSGTLAKPSVGQSDLTGLVASCMARGLSVRETAAELGLSKSKVSRLANGQTVNESTP